MDSELHIWVDALFYCADMNRDRSNYDVDLSHIEFGRVDHLCDEFIDGVKGSIAFPISSDDKFSGVVIHLVDYVSFDFLKSLRS